jgi:hypothetical protein
VGGWAKENQAFYSLVQKAIAEFRQGNSMS